MLCLLEHGKFHATNKVQAKWNPVTAAESSEDIEDIRPPIPLPSHPPPSPLPRDKIFAAVRFGRGREACDAMNGDKCVIMAGSVSYHPITRVVRLLESVRSSAIAEAVASCSGLASTRSCWPQKSIEPPSLYYQMRIVLAKK